MFFPLSVQGRVPAVTPSLKLPSELREELMARLEGELALWGAKRIQRRGARIWFRAGPFRTSLLEAAREGGPDRDVPDGIEYGLILADPLLLISSGAVELDDVSGTPFIRYSLNFFECLGLCLVGGAVAVGWALLRPAPSPQGWGLPAILALISLAYGCSVAIYTVRFRRLIRRGIGALA